MHGAALSDSQGPLRGPSRYSPRLLGSRRDREGDRQGGRTADLRRRSEPSNLSGRKQTFRTRRTRAWRCAAAMRLRDVFGLRDARIGSKSPHDLLVRGRPEEDDRLLPVVAGLARRGAGIVKQRCAVIKRQQRQL